MYVCVHPVDDVVDESDDNEDTEADTENDTENEEDEKDHRSAVILTTRWHSTHFSCQHYILYLLSYLNVLVKM